MKNVIIVLYLIVSGLLAAGCSAAAEGPVEAKLGEEFTIAIGEEAVITGEDLGIRFEEVIEDSRCPLNVECPWAGQAKYTLSFTHGDASESAVVTELGLGGRGQATVFDYEITAQLGPYPEDPGDIVAEDYYLDLTVKSLPPAAFSLKEQADIYGAVIRVGNIVPGEGETVEVAGSIYVANLAAGGRTYILEKQDGTWKITGNTGPIWIS